MPATALLLLLLTSGFANQDDSTPAIQAGAPLAYAPLEGAEDMWFGAASVWLDDVNRDGWHDLAVPAPRLVLTKNKQSKQRRGVVLILSGSDGSVLRTLRSLPGETKFGFTLSTTDDLDADGSGELVVWFQSDESGEGVLRCISPRTEVVHWECDSAPSGTYVVGVESLSDVDGDGVRDLVAWGGDPNQEQVYTAQRIYSYQRLQVLSGADGSVLAERDLESDGFLRITAVRPVEDLDDDGCGDLVMLLYEDIKGVIRWRLELASSATGETIAELPVPVELGGELETADLDGDGRPEVLVSTQRDSSAVEGAESPTPGELLVFDVGSKSLRHSVVPHGAGDGMRVITSFDVLLTGAEPCVIVGSCEDFKEQVFGQGLESGLTLWTLPEESSDERTHYLPPAHFGDHLEVDPSPDEEGRTFALTGTGNPHMGGNHVVWCFDPLTGEVRFKVNALDLFEEAGL